MEHEATREDRLPSRTVSLDRPLRAAGLCPFCPCGPIRLPPLPVGPEAVDSSVWLPLPYGKPPPEPWATLAARGVAAAARTIGSSERTFRRHTRLGHVSPRQAARFVRAAWLVRLLAREVTLEGAARELGLSSSSAVTRFCESALGERPAALRRLLIRCQELCERDDERPLTIFGQALDDPVTPSTD